MTDIASKKGIRFKKRINFNKKINFNIGDYLISIIITFGLGYISLVLSRNFMNNYKQVVKPFFFPPQIIIYIIWALVYLLMANSLYFTWQRIKKNGNIVFLLITYIIQVLLISLWSVLFYRYDIYWLSFYEMIICSIFFVFTIKGFFKRDKVGGIILIPVLIWSLFLCVLNYLVMIFN